MNFIPLNNSLKRGKKKETLITNSITLRFLFSVILKIVFFFKRVFKNSFFFYLRNLKEFKGEIFVGGPVFFGWTSSATRCFRCSINYQTALTKNAVTEHKMS